VIEAIKKGFEEGMGIEFHEEGLTKEEIKLAEKLREKYESKEWNFKR